MMYQEFEALVKKAPTSKQYHDFIEPVYMYHPMFSVDNTEMKNKFPKGMKVAVAELYNMCGLAIFAEMKPVADKFLELEQQRDSARQMYNAMCKKYEEEFEKYVHVQGS